jgi:hypothetical protein
MQVAETFSNFIPEEPIEEPFQLGKCKFKILELKHAISKSNNPKIELKVRLTDANGVTRVKKCENLTLSPASKWRVREFAIAIDKKSFYDQGKLPDQVILNAEGYCDVGEELFKDKYGVEKVSLNIIKWLEPIESNFLTKSIEDNFEDKDIPF